MFTTLTEISDPLNPITYSGKVIASNNSPLQNWCILDTDEEGEILFINNTLQSCKNDEVQYHEMFVHSLMSGCKEPSSVLILGGSEGCMAREVLKWNVTKVTQVDWDETLISYFKNTGTSWNSNSYNDPRVTIVISEALKWLNDCTEKFDCIFIDLFDPTSEIMDFIKSILIQSKRILTSGGALSINAGSLSQKVCFKLSNIMKDIFDDNKLYGAVRCSVPSFKDDWVFLMGVSQLWSINIHEKCPSGVKYYNKERLIKSMAWDKENKALSEYCRSKKLTQNFTQKVLDIGVYNGC